MKKLVIIIFSIFVAIALIVGSMIFLSQSTTFYSLEFNKLGVIESAKIQEDSKDMAKIFTKYFSGEIEEFQMQAKVNGEIRALYNEREQLHMIDVKNLVKNGNIVTGFTVGMGLLMYLYLLLRKKYKELAFFVKSSIGIYYGLLISLGVIMIFKFQDAFRIFHELLFNNDLWLLNQNKDYLLMLMPQQLYVDMLIYSFIISNITIILLGVITWKITTKRKKSRMFY